MQTVLITIAEPSAEIRLAISAPLRAYNAQFAPPLDTRNIAIVLQHAGHDVGGLWAKIAWDWAFIDLLVVPESLRGQGFGAALVDEIESIAQAQGCIGVWLDTFEFQSRGFYERRGYRLFGEIQDHPRGSCRYFLSKRL